LTFYCYVPSVQQIYLFFYTGVLPFLICEITQNGLRIRKFKTIDYTWRMLVNFVHVLFVDIYFVTEKFIVLILVAKIIENIIILQKWKLILFIEDFNIEMYFMFFKKDYWTTVVNTDIFLYHYKDLFVWFIVVFVHNDGLLFLKVALNTIALTVILYCYNQIALHISNYYIIIAALLQLISLLLSNFYALSFFSLLQCQYFIFTLCHKISMTALPLYSLLICH
jgi:hypothetical protein